MLKAGEGVPGTHGGDEEMEQAKKELDVHSFYSWKNQSTANPPICQGFLWDFILEAVTLLQVGSCGEKKANNTNNKSTQMFENY